MVDKISFIGIGKLGLPLASCFAKNGISVIASDKNQSLIDKLNNDELPFFEPGLEEHLSQAKGNIKYQTNHDGFETTDITVILVNTPNNPETSAFSNHQLLSALDELCDTLIKHDKKNHNFIISSTVMPGVVRDTLIPMIETKMGWTLNEEFKLAYVPDFVALGTVIRDFEKPNLMVLGSSDEEFGDVVESLYKRIIKNGVHIHKMNPLEAELSKITFNAFLLSKISFVNFIGNVCDKYGGVDVDTITNAVASDKRISHESKMFFKSGLSWGGACWPRDVWAFQEMCKNIDLKPHHIEAAEKINHEQDDLMIEYIKETGKKKIGFFGVAFKPETPVTMFSVAEKITQRLVDDGFEIHCHDFVQGALDEFYGKFGDSVSYHIDMKECLDSCDVVVILTPWKEYKSLSTIRDNQIVIDGWRLIDEDFDGLIQPGKNRRVLVK